MITSVEKLAGLVTSGAKIALPVDYAGVSMAMTRPLIARGLRDLHLVCVPTGGIQPDMFIGAGMVKTIETSAMTLGEAGGAPCFGRAVQQGSVKLMDATCPAVHAGFLASQKGAPFAVMRGLIGTDLLANRPDWKIIDNPFSEDKDPIVAIPAIRPDFAIFHAPLADRFGNVWIGRRRELGAMAYASATTLVTVERVVDDNLLSDEKMAAGVLPALYIEAVAEAKFGAKPYGLWGEYAPDTAEIMRYAGEARTPEGFAAYLAASDRKLETVA
ncbi:3-oxoadipate CoA-transferase subunit A [Variibacter gotjawalensis]|uniref:3-oxoadipate CoA-transferase subunit A n=1 Tax=Variibacter gotjawalensis TaxID=1333996 RepID=A0A0S3PZQ9_9BRAD|nr:CoA transferase [Variibacter gotjawalensis]NIK47261.1 glutaconate CoA-transferase subunit A [Variibacter gotjawalensis]RZS49161.1 glutaconate CoA-transferase subunit A [Variibacter gotjawalensis]BAT61423.1 3-oxoadipate CoA-transferase subunit A [Variibacter gotjawalensis]